MARKKKGEDIEKIDAEVVEKPRGNKENLVGYGFDEITAEKQREIASKGGIASGKARREKKTARQVAKMFLEMNVPGEADAYLKQMGFEKEDRVFKTAIVAALGKKAAKGDPQSIKLLMELAGEVAPSNGFGFDNPDGDLSVIDVEVTPVLIPDNGRDKIKSKALQPQHGPQTMFMTSEADIVIYGGAAGGGKTYAILLEGLRHKDVRGFQGVIFRRQNVQIDAPGGLRDASQKLYEFVPYTEYRKGSHTWMNKNAPWLKFSYIESYEDTSRWQGSEICYLAFDELTHFDKNTFLYMLSRNRSTCGIKPYVRATCNPDADSWVAEFIAWWIDEDTGYPIQDRSGKIRWMINMNDEISWFDNKKDAVEFALSRGIPEDQAEIMPKSVTFIASSVQDNKILMENDPGYIANLRALSELDMERLLKGNWKIKAAAGAFFKRTQVEIIKALPTDIKTWVRAWDYAATDKDEAGDPDYTASVLMGKRDNGQFVVANVTNDTIKALEVEKMILNTSNMDKPKYKGQYRVRLAQDPGAAGKIVAKQFIKMLAGFDVKAEPVSGSKELRATPLAAQWQAGNVQVLEGAWNEAFFNQLESFPESKHDDMVDAASDAFIELVNMGFNIDNLL